MCQKIRPIYNRYIRQFILADCGKCPECQQKKASARASRIRNHLSTSEICLFVTLTYDNDFVPYICLKDLRSRTHCIPIYRDYYIKQLQDKEGRFIEGFEFVRNKEPLDYIYWHYGDDKQNTLNNIKILNKKRGCVGVCYYKDFQDFNKRLRQKLVRDYGFQGKYSTFQCTEYGGSSYRPHMHVLFFIPADEQDTFRRAISESWLFASEFRYGNNEKWIEVARNPASYVASYVNGSELLPAILSSRKVKSRHVMSQDFGVRLECFKISKILEKAAKHDLSYNVGIVKDGIPTIATFSIPQYVINRYFPKFKGMSFLNSVEIGECLQCLEKLRFKFPQLNYTDDDLHKFKVRLYNCYEKYKKALHADYENFGSFRSFYDYVHDYLLVWNAYKSYTLKHSHDEVDSVLDYQSFYDNGYEYNDGSVRSLNLDEFLGRKLEDNPVEIIARKESDYKYRDLYNKLCKQKNVTNYVMSACGDNV